jgi:branched-chain amino acid transport system permease protein
VRMYQLVVFVIGSVLAGMSGALYTLWGSYITPSSMGLTAAALPIIWVAAGGRKDITATLLATVLLTWLSQQLAVKGNQYALIWMGAILLTVVLFAPRGLFVSLWKTVHSRAQRRRRSTTAKPVSSLSD